MMTRSEHLFVDDAKFDLSEEALTRPRGNSWTTANILAFAMHETLQSAGLICAATSVANALAADDDPIVSQDAILAHLPPQPRFMTDFTGMLIGAHLEVRLFLALRDFELRLQTVRSMSHMFCQFPANVPLKGGVHVDVLSGTWRNVCEEAIALLRMLRAVPCMAIDGGVATRLSRTLALLIDCANGGTPCVLEDGSIEVPGFVERRRNARITVDWSAMLLLGPEDAVVQITNISPGGLNFTTRETLSVLEGITVQLPAGRCLRGTVVWANAGMCGMKFSTPLGESDPLLLLARRPAS